MPILLVSLEPCVDRREVTRAWPHRCGRLWSGRPPTPRPTAHSRTHPRSRAAPTKRARWRPGLRACGKSRATARRAYGALAIVAVGKHGDPEALEVGSISGHDRGTHPPGGRCDQRIGQRVATTGTAKLPAPMTRAARTLWVDGDVLERIEQPSDECPFLGYASRQRLGGDDVSGVQAVRLCEQPSQDGDAIIAALGMIDEHGRVKKIGDAHSSRSSRRSRTH